MDFLNTALAMNQTVMGVGSGYATGGAAGAQAYLDEAGFTSPSNWFDDAVSFVASLPGQIVNFAQTTAPALMNAYGNLELGVQTLRAKRDVMNKQLQAQQIAASQQLKMLELKAAAEREQVQNQITLARLKQQQMQAALTGTMKPTTMLISDKASDIFKSPTAWGIGAAAVVLVVVLVVAMKK
jgi:hypothetical protein